MYLTKNFLPSNECTKLIKLFNDIEKYHGIDYKLNNTRVIHFDDFKVGHGAVNIIYQDLFNKITNYINLIDNNCTIDYFQIVKWKKNSYMNVHTDHSHQLYSSIINLNDDYIGGETVIEDTTVVSELGQIVTFKGNTESLSVNPILNGIRYTIPVWYKSK